MASITMFWGHIATFQGVSHIQGQLIVIIFDIFSHCLLQPIHPHLEKSFTQPRRFFGFFQVHQTVKNLSTL